MQMCLNKRVVAVLAVAAVGLFVLAPRLLGAVAPILVMAACPLSMLLMMNRMSGRDHDPDAATGGDRQVRELEEEVDRPKAEIALRDERRPA